MKALTFHGKETVRYESVPDPILATRTDVIVQVELASICGSDLHPYHEREKGLEHGTVMGHEFVGKIIEVGNEVVNLHKGMRVFCPFSTSCGACFYCRKGLTARCVHGQLFGWRENGAGLHGGQAEFVRVPLADATLLPLPEAVSPEGGLLLGDIFPTGYFCAEMAEITSQGVVAVVGCGPVGLMAILGARELCAEQIYAIDAIPERLKLAEAFGAVPVNFRECDPVAVLRNATDGRGADSVLEVVGSADAGRTAFELVRPGGVIATVGVHTGDRLSFSPVEAYDKNITYRTGRCSARHYMENLLPVVEQKKYDLRDVISHRLPLNQGVDAYRIFDKKLDNCSKVVLKVCE